MKVNVFREACCGADDQANRLDAVYEIDDSTTLEALLRKICASDFLQYSSTHNRLKVEAAGRQIAQVTPAGIAGWYQDVLPSELVSMAVGTGALHFSFCFNATGTGG